MRVNCKIRTHRPSDLWAAHCDGALSEPSARVSSPRRRLVDDAQEDWRRQTEHLFFLLSESKRRHHTDPGRRLIESRLQTLLSCCRERKQQQQQRINNRQAGGGGGGAHFCVCRLFVRSFVRRDVRHQFNRIGGLRPIRGAANDGSVAY